MAGGAPKTWMQACRDINLQSVFRRHWGDQLPGGRSLQVSALGGKAGPRVWVHCANAVNTELPGRRSSMGNVWTGMWPEVLIQKDHPAEKEKKTTCCPWPFYFSYKWKNWCQTDDRAFISWDCVLPHPQTEDDETELQQVSLRVAGPKAPPFACFQMLPNSCFHSASASGLPIGRLFADYPYGPLCGSLWCVCVCVSALWWQGEFSLVNCSARSWF